MDSRISARALAHSLGGWRTREPAYEALADGIRLLCLDNRIAARTALPAERELAVALGLSRTTVAAAYRSLRDTRHIESLRGSGSVTLPLARRDPPVWRDGTESLDLQQATPAAWPGLAAAYVEAAGGVATLLARSGYDGVGHPALRERLAQRYSARGLATTPDQILVTSGAQSAIHLLAAVLLARGDRVLVETPTYPHAADAFRRAGARLVGVPVTTDAGWDVDRAHQAFARTLPVLAYLMPDFQNPTGRTMSADESSAVIRGAERAGTTLVLDETTADLDIDRVGGPAQFGDGDAVVRVGSLGKTVWGGLRIGWIRASSDLIRRLVAARPVHDLGTPEFEQAVAALLVPRLDEIATQRGTLLREGRDAAVSALARLLPEWDVPRVDGGVALWVGLDAPLSSSLVMAARARGLLLSAGARFAVEGGYDRHLRVPFTEPADAIERAVGVLAQTWARVRGEAPTATFDLLDAVV
jgi:DNA-binding transcriptional MocR family regulator